MKLQYPAGDRRAAETQYVGLVTFVAGAFPAAISKRGGRGLAGDILATLAVLVSQLYGRVEGI